MEHPHNPRPDPVQAKNLDVATHSLEKDPEIYYSWMIWTLETGFADQDTEAMADMLSKLNNMVSGREGLSPEVWPEGARQNVQAAARKIRIEIESRTRDTVAELNLAREVYRDQLPEMFVKITDSDEWHLVEGFVMAGYYEIHPIIDGKVYKDFVTQVKRISAEDIDPE